MSPEEYANLEKVERTHWYYAGKREIVKYWIRKTYGMRRSFRLLDCGAGSGAFAESLCKEMSMIAMDDHKESLEILERRIPRESVVSGSCTSIPFPEDSFEIVTALDVVEHIPNDHLAVKEMTRVLKPGGIMVITVPAMMCLWSDWDETLHHQRRYSKTSLLKLFQIPNLEVLHSAYINSLAMPLVWLARKARRLGIGTDSRAEDQIPPAVLNHFLHFAFVAPGCSRLQLPFGVGLLLIARKNVA
jgi:ubiquinone/menaquinone biosynthesis C-methylase UbiE